MGLARQQRGRVYQVSWHRGVTTCGLPHISETVGQLEESTHNQSPSLDGDGAFLGLPSAWYHIITLHSRSPNTSGYFQKQKRPILGVVSILGSLKQEDQRIPFQTRGQGPKDGLESKGTLSSTPGTYREGGRTNYFKLSSDCLEHTAQGHAHKRDFWKDEDGDSF